ncbi:MAG: T9SS type A sorting domain-containing protein [Bacteroidales bacterium]
MKNFIAVLAVLVALSVNAQVNYYNTTTNGTYSSAIGLNNDADGANAFVGGGNSKAHGQNSFAFGNSAEATATDAISLGLSAKSNGVASFTIGSYLTAQGTNSFIIGKGITSIYRLNNTIPNSIMFGMNATKPTLFISPTYGLDKTGKVAIGNMTNPQAKLHIKADDGEQAALFIEPYTFGGTYDAELWMGTSDYGLRAAYGNLYFNTDGHYIFNSADANMGIGVLLPTEKLEVNGKVKSTGFQLINGQQGEGKYLSSDSDGNASWEEFNINSFECLASGEYANTLGKWDTASGDFSFAGGVNTKSEGHVSFAYGAWAQTSGSHSFALGVGTKATNTSSFAIGSRCAATASNSIVIGRGLSADEMLINNIDNSLMIGFSSDKPTLLVTSAFGKGSTGKVGIGDIPEPQAKLHIKGGQNEQATLFIEPYVFGGTYYAALRMGTEDYGLVTTYGRMSFKTGGNYIFDSPGAFVGIGTNYPIAKLHVTGNIFIDDQNSGIILKSPDGQCWKGMISNEGALAFEPIDCDLTTNTSPEPESANPHVVIFPNPTKDNIRIRKSDQSVLFASIIDMNGILLQTIELFENETEISLSGFSAGCYFIRITNENNQLIVNEKVIKN